MDPWSWLEGRAQEHLGNLSGRALSTVNGLPRGSQGGTIRARMPLAAGSSPTRLFTYYDPNNASDRKKRSLLTCAPLRALLVVITV
jgi:hypothetical protein